MLSFIILTESLFVHTSLMTCSSVIGWENDGVNNPIARTMQTAVTECILALILDS